MRMTDERRKKLCISCSLLSAGSIAIFWTVYYLITGSVPAETKAWMVFGNISLHFGISRWWDILGGPIWTTILILHFTNEKNVMSPRSIIAMGIALGISIITVATSGFICGLIVFGIIYGLIFWLATLVIRQSIVNLLLAK